MHLQARAESAILEVWTQGFCDVIAIEPTPFCWAAAGSVGKKVAAEQRQGDHREPGSREEPPERHRRRPGVADP